MISCRRFCRKCCPNGCCGFCKPPQIQQQIDIKNRVRAAVEEKEIPYGYIYFYAGVRTSNNSYTSPMLSVHLYRQSHYDADIVQDKRTITIDKKQQQSHQGPQQSKKNEKQFTAGGEIRMIPVEDVTHISTQLEIKTRKQADVKTEIQYKYDDDDDNGDGCCDRCYNSLLTCCRKTRDCCCYCCRHEPKVAPLVLNETTVFYGNNLNRSTSFKEELLPPKEKEGRCTRCSNFFRCWCCRKKKLLKIIKRTDTIDEQQAQRVMTITIQYSKYSNLDSASNARLLSSEQQVAYYYDRFQPDTELKFYLVNNTEFDSRDFELKRKEAEILCRTVMHLKGMRNHYPSDNEIEKILDQNHKKIFGEVFHEPILQLSLNPTTPTRRDRQIQDLSQSPQQPAIQQDRTSVSEDSTSKKYTFVRRKREN